MENELLRIQLKRTAYTAKATYGQFYLDGVPFLVSVELPWLANKKGISCIPCGLYRVIPHISPKFGECFWLQGTMPRTEILIHPANVAQRDLKGCIAPGQAYGVFPYNGEMHTGVSSSRVALKELKTVVGNKEFELLITGQF